MPLRNKIDIKRVLKAINKSVYHFSDPLKLNDPFDCYGNIKINLHNDIEYTKLLEMIQLERPDLYFLEIKRQLDSIKKNYNNNKSHINEFLYNIFNENLKNTGIYCLSKDLYNTLMWSHYANSHNGVALQFTFSNIKESLAIQELGLIDKVNYSWDIPQIQFIGGDNFDKVKNIIFTKSERWKYEKEYRIFLPEIKNDKRTFPIPLIKVRNIYFGCKVSNDVINNISSKILHSNKIFHLNMKSDRYAYNRVNLKD